MGKNVLIRRIFAMALDLALIYMLHIALLIIVMIGVVLSELIRARIGGISQFMGETEVIVVTLLIWYWSCFTFMEGMWGKTLGKKIMGLKVVDYNGNKPGFIKAAIRSFMLGVDLIIGLVVAIFDKDKHRRIGDFVAKTQVVYYR